MKLLPQIILFFGAIGLFQSAFALEPGQPIPVERYGQIGTGGLLNYPLGGMRIGDEDYLFAFSSGCRMNKNIFNLYKQIGKAADDAPLFKKQLRLPPAPSGLNRHTRVFKTRDGSVYAFFPTPKGYVRAKMNPETYEFVPFGKPLSFGNLCGIVENEDGSFYIYTAGRTVLKESEKSELHAWNGKRYVPFDGSFIWRGGEARSYLNVCKLPQITSDKLSKGTMATTTNAEVIYYTCGDSYTDADGKKHLFVGTNTGTIVHYIVGENGKLSERQLCKSGDIALRAPLINNSPIIMLRDGKPDLYTGGEGGIYYYKFEKWEEDGTPVYERDLRARETDTNIYFGSLPMVEVADVDGDGLTDIVIGNSQGQVGWAKNVGKPGEPKFTEPKLFRKEGEDFMEKGGYLNVQGPMEAQWGYVGPTLFDWDGDGKLDLITGDNSSHFGVYFNKTSSKTPNFSERKLLYCDGLEVHGTWRQRPGVAKLNNGKVAYVILDWDDQIRLYWQLDKRNLVDAGKLLLTDGNPITGRGRQNGECGRVKFSLVDVDKDGKTDLLLGTIGCNSIPSQKKGIPNSLKRRGAAVLWLKNVGSDDKPVLEYPRLMTVKTLDGSYEVPNLGWHSCSADLVDFGGELKGIIVGMEDGNIIFYKDSDIKWEDFNSVKRNWKSK